MILREYLNENEVYLSKKGILAMSKAIKDVFASIDDGVPDEALVRYVLGWELKEEDYLKIMQLTSKYAKLWIFS